MTASLRVISHYFDASLDEDDQYVSIELSGPDTGKTIDEFFYDINTADFEEEHGTIDCGGDENWYELDLVDERDSKEEAEAAGISLMSAICIALGLDVS